VCVCVSVRELAALGFSLACPQARLCVCVGVREREYIGGGVSVCVCVSV